MSEKLPISAFIIAKDEADRILDAIKTVQPWVDEVIVVDSGSTDETVALAKQAGCRVFFNAWQGYGLQKRFAEDQCRHQWLLNLDADERLTPELIVEIKTLFAPLPKADIYNVHIVDVFPHEKTAKSWAYGYWQYRLYRKDKGRFSDSTVHDTVRPNPEADIQTLKGKMLHNSQRSIQFFVEKCNRYSSMQIEDMIGRGRRVSRMRLLTEFPVSFVKSYIIRKSFLYGWWGLIVAMNYAYFRFMRIAKYYERQLNEDKS